MTSPFPGMDPYLEKYWHEVQKGLVVYAADELNTYLPRGLRARLRRRRFPDAGIGSYCFHHRAGLLIVEHPRPPSPDTEAETGVAIEEEPLNVTPQ